MWEYFKIIIVFILTIRLFSAIFGFNRTSSASWKSLSYLLDRLFLIVAVITFFIILIWLGSYMTFFWSLICSIILIGIGLILIRIVPILIAAGLWFVYNHLKHKKGDIFTSVPEKAKKRILEKQSSFDQTQKIDPNWIQKDEKKLKKTIGWHSNLTTAIRYRSFLAYILISRFLWFYSIPDFVDTWMYVCYRLSFKKIKTIPELSSFIENKLFKDLLVETTAYGLSGIRPLDWDEPTASFGGEPMPFSKSLDKSHVELYFVEWGHNYAKKYSAASIKYKKINEQYEEKEEASDKKFVEFNKSISIIMHSLDRITKKVLPTELKSTEEIQLERALKDSKKILAEGIPVFRLGDTTILAVANVLTQLSDDSQVNNILDYLGCLPDSHIANDVLNYLHKDKIEEGDLLKRQGIDLEYYKRIRNSEEREYTNFGNEDEEDKNEF